ncbi:MAG: primosomal protein N', partial [Gammaproteobacteria bacterium]|nr:primosomal protein N' [Gammaproteobacteria bacterium]
MPVVRVALPVPLKQEFDYSHTEALERGVRVTVPFGHRTLNGIVTDNVELPDTTQTLKNIQSVIDLEALNQSMWWSFIEKASSYY